MQEETKQLVKIRHGSHLYGTSTPASDTDFKGVHLPSGRKIILQRPENVIDGQVKLSDTIKNQAGDIDYQSYSLQKFLKMLADGDTVATEILFAPQESIVESDPLWLDIQAQGKHLLNRQCKGFVGYCVRQAAKYGIKGSRMKAVKLLVDFLKDLPPSEKLQTVAMELDGLVKREEHMFWENIPSPNASVMWHIVCCDRKMPMTTHIGEAYKVYNKVWENYGDRARAAMNNEGIDWKAISHAVRVARQAIELLTTGKITFPRPDAVELLAIKQGKIPYDEVEPMLESLVAEVQSISLTSTLPEKSDMNYVDELVFHYYTQQTN